MKPLIIANKNGEWSVISAPGESVLVQRKIIQEALVKLPDGISYLAHWDGGFWRQVESQESRLARARETQRQLDAHNRSLKKAEAQATEAPKPTPKPKKFK